MCQNVFGDFFLFKVKDSLKKHVFVTGDYQSFKVFIDCLVTLVLGSFVSQVKDLKPELDNVSCCCVLNI